MTTVTPIFTTGPYYAQPVTAECVPHTGRSRRRALSHAGMGAGMLNQQLPLAVGAHLRVSNGILFPVAGAALGAFLLGAPGFFLGGLAGWFFARR